MLSVIIPALNSASTIPATLSSILANKVSTTSFEVLMVDNGSSDNTVEVARRFPVEVLHCQRRGIGSARNLGVKKARGSIVCFTDADCVVEMGWLQKIGDFLTRNPDAVGVGGPVLPRYVGQSKVQKLTGELFVEDQGYPKEVKRIQFGSSNGIIFGSNSAYRKEILVSAGLFDQGGSNLELSWRLARMKHALFFDPHIKVYHAFPWSLSGVLSQQFRWGSQSTHMRIVNGLSKENMRATGLIPYFLGRRLLRLISTKNLEMKMLHLVQLASYGLGQVYGFSH